MYEQIMESIFGTFWEIVRNTVYKVDIFCGLRLKKLSAVFLLFAKNEILNKKLRNPIPPSATPLMQRACLLFEV